MRPENSNLEPRDLSIERVPAVFIKAPATLSRPVVPSSADLMFPDYCRPNLSRQRTGPLPTFRRQFPPLERAATDLKPS